MCLCLSLVCVFVCQDNQSVSWNNVLQSCLPRMGVSVRASVSLYVRV